MPECVDSRIGVLLTTPVRSPLLGPWAGTVARGSGKRFGGASESLLVHRHHQSVDNPVDKQHVVVTPNTTPNRWLWIT